MPEQLFSQALVPAEHQSNRAGSGVGEPQEFEDGGGRHDDVR